MRSEGVSSEGAARITRRSATTATARLPATPSMASAIAQSLLAGSTRTRAVPSTNPFPDVMAVAALAKLVVADRSLLATRRSRGRLTRAVWQTSFAQRCVVLVAVVVACRVETWNA